MESVGTRYTINSVPDEPDIIPSDLEDQVVSYVKYYGPSLSKALDAVYEAVLDLPEIKKGDIFSSEITIGPYDYAFAWNRSPRVEQIRRVVKTIDQAIQPTGVRYTITTKSWKEIRQPATSAEKHKAKQVAAKHQFKKDYQEFVGQPR